MPRNGTGTFTPPASSWNPPVLGVIAQNTDWAALLADLSSALTQSVSSDGQTPMTGPLPMGNNKITGLATGTANTDAANMGNLNAAAGQAGGVGDRNLLINANFAVNQEGYVSGTATVGANQYVLDQWRVTTTGQSITFGAAAPDRVVTCPAGGLEQPIEAGMVVGGVYTLSWTGTATATVNGVSIVSGGNTSSLPANTQILVKFSSGTVDRAQFEPGTTATPYQRRQLSTELVLCKRFFQILQCGFQGQVQNGTGYGATVVFPVEMRAIPTCTYFTDAVLANFPTGLSFGQTRTYAVDYGKLANGTGAGQFSTIFKASARL